MEEQRRLNGGGPHRTPESYLYEDEEVTNRMREVTKYSVAWCTWIERIRAHTNLHDFHWPQNRFNPWLKIESTPGVSPRLAPVAPVLHWIRCTECDTGVVCESVCDTKWNAVHVQSSHCRHDAHTRSLTLYQQRTTNERYTHLMDTIEELNTTFNANTTWMEWKWHTILLPSHTWCWCWCVSANAQYSRSYSLRSRVNTSHSRIGVRGALEGRTDQRV